MPADPPAPAAAHPRWRLLETPAADGPFNMAVDELLMESVRAGATPILRLYTWSPPCLSLGRNQPARDFYDQDRLAAAGIDIVRRLTGGRAVLHDGEVTYSVIAPARTFGTARGAYRLINQVLVSALRGLGAGAAVHSRRRGERVPRPSTTPCFAAPVDGEVVAGGRKVIGSAQLCERGVLLQHGSIPLRSGKVLADINAGPASDIDSVGGVLDDLIPGVTAGAVAEQVRLAWSRAVGALHEAPLHQEELERASELAGRYRGENWTWRR